jgi:hypothetical protein
MARVDPVPEVSILTVNTRVGCRRPLGHVRAGAGVQEVRVGDDGSEGRLASLVTSRSTRHVSHLDTEVVTRSESMLELIIAERWNCRPDKGRQTLGNERAA